jgi:DNA-binding transcriptional LysR family regulator
VSPGAALTVDNVGGGPYAVKSILQIQINTTVNISSLDLNLLLVFDALMTEGSATRAAIRLHLTQSAVSNALNRLRSVLNDPLFVRTRAGMDPTAHAIELHIDVREGLRLIQRGVEGGSRFDPLTSTWNIRLGLSDTGELIFLPNLFRELSVIAPHMTVSTQPLPRSQASDVLESGDVDLVIGYAPHFGSSVYRQRLFDDKLVCLVREDHPRVGKKLTIKTFSKELHVAIAPVLNKLNPFEAALQRLNIERRVALRVGHFSTIPNVIRKTDLLGCVPTRAAKEMAPLNGIRTLKLPFEYTPVVMNQFWHRRNNHDVKSRWLRALMLKVIAME